MSTEGTSRPSIKVTDKRLFTEEGDLRDPAPPEESEKEKGPDAASEPVREDSSPVEEPERTDSGVEKETGDAEDEIGGVGNPQTMFTNFIDSLVVNAYMALGMVRNPYGSQQEIDVHGARQMIDIIEMLRKKTEGNLSPEEAKYLEAHLGELKLAFVRRSQSIG